MSKVRVAHAVAAAAFVVGVFPLVAIAAEQPALGEDRIQQDSIAGEALTFTQIRLAGLKMFTTPFNRLDGYGDGPVDPADTTNPGGRPTLGGNTTFLRVNGLDAQTCLECHTQISAATSPPLLGIGGVGGSNSNALIAPTHMNPADFPDADGVADFNGRFANPPFIFGSGGVELLGLEMTAELQAIKQQALANPGVEFELTTKGVHFGTIQADLSGELDLSQVEGISDDLVVRPFGRKGEFASVREFDIGAMRFHFGMEPVEAVGENVDNDGDGVINEILVGELSALSIFLTTSDRPQVDPLTIGASRGFQTFNDIGCTTCHMPALETDGEELPYRFPEIPDQPFANEFYRANLTQAPARFDKSGSGGLVVPLFADLKRHDMGPALAETFDLADEATNREFTTARLWGIADTAPYLHDGRATTLTDAILWHGGEAQAVRDAFAALTSDDKDDLLAFLRSLRTPHDPFKVLLNRARAAQNASGGEESADGTVTFRQSRQREAAAEDDLVRKTRLE
jgi:hypothetical protein